MHGKIIIAFQSFHDRERDDYLVGNVHHDDFVELVRRVLANPVRVEDAESTAAAADTLLGDGLQVAGGLQAVDTVGDRLAVGAALGNGALAAAAAHSDAVDAEAYKSIQSVIRSERRDHKMQLSKSFTVK